MFFIFTVKLKRLYLLKKLKALSLICTRIILMLKSKRALPLSNFSPPGVDIVKDWLQLGKNWQENLPKMLESKLPKLTAQKAITKTEKSALLKE